jgi:hypothetical protein
LGSGELTRAEILDRLGVRDFARVAQLSAEEAFRLLQQKHTHDHQSVWARFETELTKRTSEIEQRHNGALHALVARTKELEVTVRNTEQQKVHEIDRANRKVEDSLREVAELRERNHELEAQMSKIARVGKKEELDFAEEARTWAGISVSEKLPRNGDFILAYRDPSGTALEPRLLVDNKNKDAVAESDIVKLVRDAKERTIPVAILVARDETQLRQADRENRWDRKDGIWILRTTRQWLPRDLDVLKPLFERMRIEGLDFLDKNSALAQEVRRTFADLDAIEKELGKASKAVQSVLGLVAKYKVRLQALCEGTGSQKKSPDRRRIGAEGVVRALLNRAAIGLVSTHDLALADIGGSLNGQLYNVHFQEEFENGRMLFDYKLREGVVTKSNGLALMRSIGLDV